MQVSVGLGVKIVTTVSQLLLFVVGKTSQRIELKVTLKKKERRSDRSNQIKLRSRMTQIEMSIVEKIHGLGLETVDNITQMLIENFSLILFWG